MSKKRDPDTLRAILASVLPQLQPVSEATPDGPNEYKAIDWFGNVYRVENPHNRPMNVDKKGRLWVKRTPPVLEIRAKDTASHMGAQIHSGITFGDESI